MKCRTCFFTDRTVDDEICRRCSRNFTRAELLDVILLGVLYLVLCRFSYYLFTGDFFTHPLTGGVSFPVRMGEMFAFPVDLSEHPWQVLTVGWTFSLVILVPVLVGLFYGVTPGMVVALVGGYYVPAPFFFLFLMLSVLIAGTRLRGFLGIGSSLLIAMVPPVAYLLVLTMPGLSGKPGMVAWLPWLVTAVMLAATVGPLLLLARWRDYQMRFLIGVVGFQAAAVLVLFHWTVGFANVEYEFLRASHWPLSADFRIAVGTADALHSAEDRRREARELYDRRRKEALDAFSNFVSWFPHDAETPLALFERAEIHNLRPAFTGTRPDALRVYTDRITPEALKDYEVIRKEFADSLVAIEARLATARYYLQHHQFDAGLEELSHLSVFCDVKVPRDYRPTGGGSALLRWRGHRLTPEERLQLFYEVLQETRREIRFIEQNSDYNRIPLMLFYQLDEHQADYDAELSRILKWFPDSRLADNIRLILLERRQYKLEELEALLAEYPKGDAAARMLLLLGEGYRERSMVPRAQEYLQRLTAEFGDSPEAARGAALLEKLRPGAGKTDTR